MDQVCVTNSREYGPPASRLLSVARPIFDAQHCAPDVKGRYVTRRYGLRAGAPLMWRVSA
jgi:hypothetical protein